MMGGCKKYPEDDKFHLSTVKCRLAGGLINESKSWQPRSGYNFIINTDIPFSSSTDVISFGRKGGFGGYMCNNYFNYSGIFVPTNSCNFRDGSWEFIDNKNKVKITDANGVSGEFSIKKLDNDELWLQSDSILFKFKTIEKKH